MFEDGMNGSINNIPRNTRQVSTHGSVSFISPGTNDDNKNSDCNVNPRNVDNTPVWLANLRRDI